MIKDGLTESEMSAQLKYYYRHKAEINKKTVARKMERYRTDPIFRKKVNEYNKLWSVLQ